MTRPITEQDVVLTIMRERHQHQTCMLRYTPSNWWECDVFELTEAGFSVEYEVKLTRADFKKDAMKADEPPRYDWRRKVEAWGPHLSKHVRLSTGDPSGPSQFYFVTLEGIVKAEDIPHWAGWAEVKRRDDYYKPPYHLYLSIHKRAPRLHKERLGEKALNAIHKCAYYRFHSAIWDLQVALNNNRGEEPAAQKLPFAEEEIDSQKTHDHNPRPN